jgi:hypothetical protein
VSAESVVLPTPIKAVGNFTAQVKVGDALQSLSVVVTAQE